MFKYDFSWIYVVKKIDYNTLTSTMRLKCKWTLILNYGMIIYRYKNIRIPLVWSWSTVDVHDVRMNVYSRL